ncbi:MAG: ABC transporter substrate-binding protein [Hyphomicrobiales bacterium]
MRISRRLVLFSALAVLVCFTAYPAAAGKKDGTLNIALEKELETLDWYYNTAREGIVLSQHAYDFLIYRDPVTFEHKPLLATSWKWLSDTVLELELRRGVVFHNGAKFSADDVVYILNYAANPDNKVKYWTYVNWIKEVKKINDYKVQIITHKPFPPAIEFLSCAMPIYPKDYYAQVGSKGFGAKPIGTGPYKVVEVEPGKKIVLEAFDNYFAGSPKGKPSIKRIVWRTIPEVNTKVAELMTGGLDWCWLIPSDQAAKLAQDPKITVVAGETMRVGFLYMDAANVTKDAFPTNPFTKLKVRQAMNYAIDAPTMSKTLVGGQSKPIDSICYPSQFGCTSDVTRYSYDPAKAKQLLAEAGYPNGFEADFYVYRDRPYAEAIVGYLAKVDIKAKLIQLQYSAMREKFQGGRVQLAFWTWGSNSINDISAIVDYWFMNTTDDIARDPKVIELLTAADGEMNVEKRKSLYKEALRIIASQAYTVPLFTWVTNYCFSSELDFTPHSDETPRFYTAKWK